MITGLPDPFATVEYADSVLSSAAWTAATEAQKESALQYARVYIEDTYYCHFDLDDAPENVQTGNAFLAESHLALSLFDAANSGNPTRGLVSQSVEAKGVKSSKSWDPAKSNAWVDPFPSITAILKLNGYCVIKKGGGIRTAVLFRR